MFCDGEGNCQREYEDIGSSKEDYRNYNFPYLLSNVLNSHSPNVSKLILQEKINLSRRFNHKTTKLK